MRLQLLQTAATASTLCDRPYQTKCLLLHIISCLQQASMSVYLRCIECYRICNTYQLQSVLLVVAGWNLQLQPVVLMRLHNHYRHWSQGMEVAYQSYTLNLLQQQRTREVLPIEKIRHIDFTMCCVFWTPHVSVFIDYSLKKYAHCSIQMSHKKESQ